MIKKRFWAPTLTSQFPVCVIPYHMDTYRGCPYNCVYCFARDFTTFARRNSENKSFTHLEANNPVSFCKWIDRVQKSDYDLNKANEVAFKERIPLKIGACSDPFPYIESKERITYEFLKCLHAIDYPVQFSTKNPEILLGYSHEFENPNWIVSVSIVTTDEEFRKVVEPSAISTERRFAAIRQLTDEGKNVLVRIQPTIYPHILDILPEMVKKIKESGAKGFIMEGLKIRISMPKQEQVLIQKIGDYFNYDLRNWYRENGRNGGSDFELSYGDQMSYIAAAEMLAEYYGLKFYSADNIHQRCGDSAECCGTEFLRNYKIFGGCYRNSLHNTDPSKFAEHLPKCIVNFVRSKKFKGMTMEEATQFKLNQMK
jgi:DNA repair photolyase